MNVQLQNKGWHLTDEGYQKCKELINGKEDLQKVVAVALQTDLRHIGKQYLPDNINSGQVEKIEGPIVLQVQKVRNVAAPLINQESKTAPRMLKLNLTDGVIHCVAIEFSAITSLNEKIIPGTKVCLQNRNINVRKGLILLKTSSDIKFLGGEVQKLKDKWETSNNKERNVKLDGPPPFYDFDPKKYQKKNQSHVADKTRGQSLSQRDYDNTKASGRSPTTKETEIKDGSKHGSGDARNYTHKENEIRQVNKSSKEGGSSYGNKSRYVESRQYYGQENKNQSGRYQKEGNTRHGNKQYIDDKISDHRQADNDRQRNSRPLNNNNSHKEKYEYNSAKRTSESRQGNDRYQNNKNNFGQETGRYKNERDRNFRR